jgi:hypothetical protein
MPHRFTSRSLIVAAALLLSACAVFNGPRTMSVPTEKVQAALDKRFPVDTRYLELFDLHISNARLTMLPEANRVATTMDVVLAPVFLKRTWKGSITLSGTLQPDALRNALVINAPRLDAFSIEGFDPAMSRQITQYGNQLAEQVLRQVPVITYEELGVPFASTALVPASVATTPEGLVVTFAPAK